LKEEKQTIDFAYACVVSIREIREGDTLNKQNVWVKRPGTGEIKAVHYESLLGKTAKHPIAKNSQIRWSDVK
jgi:N-acetylneuraminate synthase